MVEAYIKFVTKLDLKLYRTTDLQLEVKFYRPSK